MPLVLLLHPEFELHRGHVDAATKFKKQYSFVLPLESQTHLQQLSQKLQDSLQKVNRVGFETWISSKENRVFQCSVVKASPLRVLIF